MTKKRSLFGNVEAVNTITEDVLPEEFLDALVDTMIGIVAKESGLTSEQLLISCERDFKNTKSYRHAQLKKEHQEYIKRRRKAWSAALFDDWCCRHRYDTI